MINVESLLNEHENQFKDRRKVFFVFFTKYFLLLFEEFSSFHVRIRRKYSKNFDREFVLKHVENCHYNRTKNETIEKK